MFVCACLFLVCCDPACHSSAFGPTLSALIMTEIRSQIIETLRLLWWLTTWLDKKINDPRLHLELEIKDFWLDLRLCGLNDLSGFIFSFNTKNIKTVQRSQRCHYKRLCNVTWCVSECREWLCHDWMTTLSVKLLAMLPDGPWIKSDHRHRACAKSHHFPSGLTQDLQLYLTQPVTWLDLPKNMDIWSHMSNCFPNLNQVLQTKECFVPKPE